MNIQDINFNNELQKQAYIAFEQSLNNPQTLRDCFEVNGVQDKETLLDLEYAFIMQADHQTLRDVYHVTSV